MTRRWPCVLITALCWVLTIAASASAECAWVLWASADTAAESLVPIINEQE